MTAAAVTDQLDRIVAHGSCEECLAFVTGLRADERRAIAKYAIALFKAIDKDPENLLSPGNSGQEQQEILGVAILASATKSEILKLKWLALPRDEFIVELVRQVDPDWTDAWVSQLLEWSPWTFSLCRLLYRAGLCAKPEDDSYIPGMIVSLSANGGWAAALWRREQTLADRIRLTPDLLEEDIWRLFEVEGGGEASLAAHDKYVPDPCTWAAALETLADDGTVSRDRLLDASLAALARDFAQFRAGWFSRFHERLGPTPAERSARVDAYLHLLGSAVPPTVSFALDALLAIDRNGALPGDRLLAHLRPALRARGKSSVMKAFRLLESAVKRDGGRRAEAARIAVDALISERTDVQQKALDVIATLGGDRDALVAAAMAKFSAAIAPSLKGRFLQMAGGVDAVEISESHDLPPHEPHAIDPIASRDEFFAELLRVLEDAGDPVAVERMLDGFSRLAAECGDDDRRLGPLGKRAADIAVRYSADSLQFHLACLFRTWVERTELRIELVPVPELEIWYSHPAWPDGQTTLEAAFALRNAGILERVRRGHSLPMLSAPTDARGVVDATALLERYDRYRKAGVSPERLDTVLAFMRLAPDGREPLRQLASSDDALLRVLSFAAGGPVSPEDGNDWLWIAATAAQSPYTGNAAVASRNGNPDAGRAATYRLNSIDLDYRRVWSVAVEPPVSLPVRVDLLPSLFHVATHGPPGSVCGYHPNMIRWCALVWPLNPQPFFAQAFAVLDLEHRVANTPFVAFLDALLNPWVESGPMGAALLVAAMTSVDPAVKTTAIDATIQAITEGRLDIEAFAAAFATMMPAGDIPLNRWTRSFTEVAAASRQHGDVVRATILAGLTGDPPDPPRDLGGLLELLYELEVAAGSEPVGERTETYLRAVKGGGKIGAFAKKLLALGRT